MKRLALALAILLSLIAVPAEASQLPAPAASATGDAVGLVVKYRSAISPVAPNGEVTGENFVGLKLSSPHGIGNGLTAVSFSHTLSEGEAQVVAGNLRRDPRVLSVEIDHEIGFGTASLRETALEQYATLLGAVMKPATAPATIVASDAWNAISPNLAQVKATWTPPKATYGGRVTGYQVWRSIGSAAFTQAAVVSAASRSYTISNGLTAGTSVRIYVKAVTKLGVATKVGLASKTVSAVPTTEPGVPVLTGYSDGSANSPSWDLLAGAATGGLQVHYTATAMGDNQQSISCTTLSSTCELVGLATGVNYRITVTATNNRGSSSTDPVIRPSDGLFYTQWYLYSRYGINAPRAWREATAVSATPVVVAVIDTGITSHSDLNDQVLPGYDFVSSDMGSNDGDGWDSDASDPGDYSAGQDSSWHGTHVSGLIAAEANGQGIVGVDPWAKIEPVRALGAKGGKESDLYAAITWAAGGSVSGVPNNPTPAKVINISMGTTSPTSCDNLVESAFQAALSRGVTIVTAAGNGDANGNPMQAFYSYPGDCLGSINVGATGISGDSSYYSNYGLGVDISAPGGDDRDTAGAPNGSQGMIVSTFNTGTTGPRAETYVADEGTSMAAPLVSGAVALLYGINPNLTPSEVWTILKNSTKPFRADTDCALTAGLSMQTCGVGILDIAKALSLVQ
jgi:serine protease